MKTIKSLLLLSIVFSSASVFANMGSDENSACATVAKACVSAGFTKTEAVAKTFWQECMKPVLLGKTVAGVTVDAATVDSCRTYKIDKMKKELQDLENASAAKKA